MAMRRQPPEVAVSYSRQHLPKMDSVGQHPQSTLQMGERLIAYVADRTVVIN